MSSDASDTRPRSAAVAVPERFQVLALDGGGAKALFTAHVLARLEAGPRRSHRRLLRPDRRDLGGWDPRARLGAGLRPAEIVDHYTDLTARVFPRSRRQRRSRRGPIAPCLQRESFARRSPRCSVTAAARRERPSGSSSLPGTCSAARCTSSRRRTTRGCAVTEDPDGRRRDGHDRGPDVSSRPPASTGSASSTAGSGRTTPRSSPSARP